jgi:light-harvesting complex 1 alpha chain
MHRIWLLYDPRRVLVALFGALGLLAVVIHLILLSSVRYSWIENGTLSAEKAPVSASRSAVVAEMAPLPANR